jgi:hypothetical protein
MIKKIGFYVAYGLAALLIPMTYVAAVTGIDFGGKVIAVVPCTCSPYTRITFISSRGVTTGLPVSLDYFLTGTQLFSKYNLPAGRQLMGKFVPGPLCLDYIGVACKPRVIPAGGPPAIGTITPYVGSSI